MPFLLGTCLPLSLSAQGAVLPASMPFVLLSTYHDEPDAAGLFFNQAALSYLSGPSVSFFSERKYMMEDHYFFSAAMQYPSRFGNAALAVNHETSGLWSKNMLGLALGKKLGSLLSAGVQFNAASEKIPRYGNKWFMGAEAGVNLHLTSQLTAGVHFANPFSFFSSSPKIDAPAGICTAGLGYKAGETFYLAVAMRSEKGKEMDIIGGFEYSHLKRFFLRAGFTGASGACFLGAGLIHKSSRWDVSFSIHPRLGVSSGLLWTIRIKNKSR